MKKKYKAYIKKILWQMMGEKYYPLKRKLRFLKIPLRLFRFLKWAFSGMGNLLLPARQSEKRLLLVYDTSSQPFSIGDILIIHAASLALREMYGANKVDFALLYDPSDPAASDPAFESITARNALFHIASILPIAQVNQHLGSLLMFDSDLHLHRYIAESGDIYHVWPSGWKFASRDYLYYEVFNQVLYKYYKMNGTIKLLTCRPFLVEWAKTFYCDHVYPQVPVTVNMRNNMLYQTHRNSSIDEWLEFFNYCESRYPVKFIVICAWSEIDVRLRECPNVMIAKDFHTGIEQELALIHTSAMHMGVGSGPVSMAWFNTNPYLMVNTVYGENYFEHSDLVVEVEPGIQRFCFAEPFQRIINAVETTEMLINEFAHMWSAIDLNHWQTKEGSNKRMFDETHSWLR